MGAAADELGRLREQVGERDQQRHERQRRKEQHRHEDELGGHRGRRPDLELDTRRDREHADERDRLEKVEAALRWDDEGEPDARQEQAQRNRADPHALPRRHRARPALPALADKLV
jgi:hypothetical protein